MISPFMDNLFFLHKIGNIGKEEHQFGNHANACFPKGNDIINAVGQWTLLLACEASDSSNTSVFTGYSPFLFLEINQIQVAWFCLALVYMVILLKHYCTSQWTGFLVRYKMEKYCQAKWAKHGLGRKIPHAPCKNVLGSLGFSMFFILYATTILGSLFIAITVRNCTIYTVLINKTSHHLK